MTNWRINLLLLTVLLALLALVFLGPGADPAKPHTPLTSLHNSEITQLILRTSEKRVLSFSKTNGNWQLLANNGLIYPARESQVQNLLGILHTESIRQYRPAEVSLQKLGLQPAAASMKINNTLIELGNTDPLQQNRYALVDKSAVHLFTDRYSHLLYKATADWIDTALLPPDSVITAIEHVDFNLSIRNGLWQLQDKGGKEIAASSQDSLIAFRDEWLHAQALRLHILDEQALATIGDQPQITLSVESQDKSLTFVWIEHDKGLTLVRKELAVAYEFSQDAAHRLLTPELKPTRNQPL